jgi:hypothetical protein
MIFEPEIQIGGVKCFKGKIAACANTSVDHEITHLP